MILTGAFSIIQDGFQDDGKKISKAIKAVYIPPDTQKLIPKGFSNVFSHTELSEWQNDSLAKSDP